LASAPAGAYVSLSTASLVTIRVADARLLASTPGPRVALLGAPGGWEEALRATGAELGAADPELVVAAGDRGAQAAAIGAESVILLGGATRALRRAGYRTRSFVVRPGPIAPRLFVPLDARAARAYALLARHPGRSAGKRLATRATLLAAGSGVPVTPLLTVGERGHARPSLLAAAAAASGVELGSDWFLWLGQGDDLQRAVWVCFGTDGRPAWAVKCSRVPGNVAPFEREEAAWRMLVGLPPELRRHASRFAGRFHANGLAGSIESAATGVPLQDELEAGVDRRSTIDAVADWIVAVGKATLQPSEALAPELARLSQFSPELVRSLPEVPAVFQHNDLGSWNVMVDGPLFTVLDWESNCEAGLPLWDLVYFLTDALAARRAQTDPSAKLAAMLQLLRGDVAASRLLFERVGAAAKTFGVARSHVGAIVTLGWRHHGRSSAARTARGLSHGAASSLPAAGPLERLVEPWLADPSLGVAWSAFTATGA
jgi:hypothetical protein